MEGPRSGSRGWIARHREAHEHAKKGQPAVLVAQRRGIVYVELRSAEVQIQRRWALSCRVWRGSMRSGGAHAVDPPGRARVRVPVLRDSSFGACFLAGPTRLRPPSHESSRWEMRRLLTGRSGGLTRPLSALCSSPSWSSSGTFDAMRQQLVVTPFAAGPRISSARFATDTHEQTIWTRLHCWVAPCLQSHGRELSTPWSQQETRPLDHVVSPSWLPAESNHRCALAATAAGTRSTARLQHCDSAFAPPRLVRPARATSSCTSNSTSWDFT
jgi:hypothetical protein